MHALHVLTHRMWFDERLQCVPWAVLVPVDQLQQRPGLQSGVELWVQHFARDVIRERITQRFQRRGVSYPRGSSGVGPCVDEQLRHAIAHTDTDTDTDTQTQTHTDTDTDTDTDTHRHRHTQTQTHTDTDTEHTDTQTHNHSHAHVEHRR